MVDRQKKMGRTEMQKIEYHKNKKSFVDEIKSSLIVFEGLSFGEKNKNWMEIADTSFKIGRKLNFQRPFFINAVMWRMRLFSCL